MPDDLVLVYEKATGTPLYMHSIDASEALRIGDYTLTTPEGTAKPSPEAMAAARSRTSGVNVNPHPELQTPEEREATRAAAAEAAALAAGQAPAESFGVQRALGVPQTPP